MPAGSVDSVDSANSSNQRRPHDLPIITVAMGTPPICGCFAEGELSLCRLEMAEHMQTMRDLSFIRLSRTPQRDCSRTSSVTPISDDDSNEQLYVAVESSTSDKERKYVYDDSSGAEKKWEGKRDVDVIKLRVLEKQLLMDKLIKHVQMTTLLGCYRSKERD